MPARPRLTALAEALPATVPFVGPETQERARGKPFRARIGANESGFGPSPAVIRAMAETAGEVWKYGDPENYELKAALAAHAGVRPENIACGEGIDGLLGLVVRLFVEPGMPVVTSLGGYPTFNYHVAGFGGRLVTVPYVEEREDIDGLIEAARREDAAVVYFANPDNPMGSWWEAGDVQRLIEGVPEGSLLVLDEAYCEFAPENILPPLDMERPNVLRMRTFSKAYGMAGLRCGYAIGEAGVIRAFDKVRNHFGLNRMAQTAALAALADQAWLAHVKSEVDRARRRIAAVAEANGLRALPSATNFVAVDCGGGSLATKVMQGLIERGVFVRKPGAPVLDRCIRVSCGPAEAMDIFEAEFPAALAAARG